MLIKESKKIVELLQRKELYKYVIIIIIKEGVAKILQCN